MSHVAVHSVDPYGDTTGRGLRGDDWWHGWIALRQSRNRPRGRGRIAAVAVAMLIGLTACMESEERAVPSPTAELELVIVTPTPGSPRPVAPTPMRSDRYLVREGDTLSGIAANYGLTEIEIQEANDLDNPDQLIPGQELIIPSPEP